MTALPSLTVKGRRKSFCDMAYVATQLPTLTRVMMRVWKPKMKMDSISGGIRQATTVHMIFSTDSLLFTWGDMETVQKEDSLSGPGISFTCSSMTFLYRFLSTNLRYS